MNISSLDWAALDRIRDAFLARDARRGAYWDSTSDLACYDATFGERIGWKWDAVLRELKLRRWVPPPGPVLDFGCGSGIAGRRVVAAFGAERFTSLTLHDRSPLAEDFAAARAGELFPGLPCIRAGGVVDDTAPVGTLVVSHVLNELPEAGRRALRSVAARAEAIVWVEPGTHADSRALLAFREGLRGSFSVVAPCTHGGACGMASPGNERHWCHHFAEPPPSLYADSDWTRFAQRAGIDLRSLPYSFLVMAKDPAASGPVADAAGAARIIGRADHMKGFAEALVCDDSGLRELMLQKRDVPEAFKSLRDEVETPLFRLRAEGSKVRQADRWPEGR